MSVLAACILVLVAVIGAAGAVIAAIVGSRKQTKAGLDEIHVLVNGRLDAALKEIVALRGYIGGLVEPAPGDAQIPPPH